MVYQNPAALLFKGAASSPIGAEVCGNCGRIALRALDPAALLGATKPASPEAALPDDVCLQCGEHMTEAVNTCPACGWTFTSSDG